MKRLNTLFLSAALVTLTAAPELRAQTTDAPTTGESITIELTETKDKEINIGAFAPAGNAWIDINGDGVCQDNERLGRNSTRPEDYTDIFYMGPEIETFTLDEKTQMVHIYGEIEAIRFEKSYTQTSPINIDLSKATTPKYIRIYECEELTDVTFPTLKKNNCEVLLIQYTALQELDLSSFEKLKVLVTSFNEQLRSVKQTKCEDMEELDFSFTLIPSVDLSLTPALASLYLCKAQLSEIDLTPTPDLEWLSIGANNLTKIDLSKTPGLTYLSIYDNELKEIDVTPLSNLEILEVEQNKLTKLDLSKNTNLKELTLHLNEITALDLSMLEELHFLSIFENNISEQAMQQVIDKMPRCKTMPEDEGDELWGALYVVNTKSPNGNVCNTLQVAKLKEMGWKPYDLNGADPLDFMNGAVEYEGSTPTHVATPTSSDELQITCTPTAIRVEGLAPRTVVTLFDAQGQLLTRVNSLRSPMVQISRDALPAGAYILSIAGKSYKVVLD